MRAVVSPSRVGLGCMRLLDENRDEGNALATIEAALDAGVTWLDTARAYGPPEHDLGHNEAFVARALEQREASTPSVRIMTKCGMARPERRWEPDGRATTVMAHARASVAALGKAPDVLLLHAPDPNVALATSLRALVRAKDEGLARAIGLSNVTRKQLDAAMASHVPVSVVQVALGAYDDAAARGGVIAWCKERKIPVFAHSVFGGPKRFGKLDRDGLLRVIAKRHDATPYEIVIAYLLAVDPIIVPIIGARRLETVRSMIAAERIVLEEQDLEALDGRFPGIAMTRRPKRSPPPDAGSAEVVIVMGLVGSGKSRLAEAYVTKGYERLNRDTVGGTLKGLAQLLDGLLARGAKRIVLDNTYVTRAARSEVLRIAHGKGAYVRCVFLDTPPHEAQVNITLRMLEKHGELLGGAELKQRAKTDANLFDPNTLFRMEKQIERPSEDEGFASIEILTFERATPMPLTPAEAGGAGVALPIELVLQASLAVREEGAATLSRVPPDVPILLFGWKPGADDAWRAAAMKSIEELQLQSPHSAEQSRRRQIEIGVCPHASGPPVCWCRPPLPGLWLDFARRHKIDPRLSLFMAVTAAQRTMAKNLGIKTI